MKHTIVFYENKSYQTCQVFKTWQVLKPKYLSEHLYTHVQPPPIF